MKKITEEEFKDYMEYKKFISEESMSMDELDQVTAAKGSEDFAAFMRKVKDMEKEDDTK
ncbi:MAG: hypothetical protein Q4A65_00875 [Bacillota bacterium]|nr:hypothetical protein [Bacillota bacterium]